MSHSLTAPQNALPEPRRAASVDGQPRVYQSRFGDKNVGFFKLLRSEAIKLTSLASTYWLLGIALILPIAFGALMVMATNSMVDFNGYDGVPAGEASQMKSQATEAAKELARHIPIIGVYFSNLIFASWAVVTIAGEYNTGMIRSTMSAAPKRWPAVLAKTLVMAFAAGLVAIVSMLLTYLLAQALLDPTLHYSLGDGNVMRTILMAALYVVLIAIMAFGVALLLRNTAGSIVLVIAILFVLPIILGIIGSRVDWLSDMSRFLPSNLGDAMMSSSDETHEVRPDGPQSLMWNVAALWMGVWSLVIWAAGLLTAQKRDV